MNFTQPVTLAICLIIANGFLANDLSSQTAKNKIPDFTTGDKIPDSANHDWNLGATGARGWIYSNRLETTEARQILITQVQPNSPAWSVLANGDVVLGTNTNLFSYDPRKELALAITAAEATDGILKLTRWRQGETAEVKIQLDILGGYSPTAPFDCAKSKRIFEQGCEALAKKMQANPNEPNHIVRVLNTLALLSSGNEKYLPIVTEQVKWAAQYSDVKGKSLCCWFYGPINMLIAEYTLATGDTTYLADLERITMEIVGGQSAVGSWGHRFSRPDGRLNGYGMMNAPGLPMTVSLILARKAGVNNSQLAAAIEKSTRLMRFYVGKGSVPYGDHAPWMQTHDDNGKNGIAALLFNLLDDTEAAEYFSRMSIASHGGDRELGHTGNFFNMLWAMPAVALSGPNATGKWVKEFGWYYDLARQFDGTFRHQGPAQPRSDRYNGWDSTGAYLLAYAQPYRQLFITGKKSNVVDSIDAATAEQLVADGRGFSHRVPKGIYAERSDMDLLAAVSNWSPVVRQRAAHAIASRKSDLVPALIKKLQSSNLHSQLGACQTLAELKRRGSPAVPALQKTLDADDLWLRVSAAQALAAIGKPARVTIPQLLAMLQSTDAQTDPRGMQQRYLCFALFDSRNGLLKGSLEGVDRQALYAAVRIGLENEDGRARGVIASVYKNLSYEEIEPLLPAIYDAAAKSAPSGIMFADGIRLSGLEILAQHKIKEALPLCIEIMELDRWGSGKRITSCLNSIQAFGTAARDLAPQLATIKKRLSGKRNKNDKLKKQLDLIEQTIAKISSNQAPPKLRSLNRNSQP